MKEIKNPEFSPKIPKFVCDDPNNKIPQPFPKSHFNMTLIGRPGSGKSSLATCIIAGKHRGHSVYRKQFYNIIIICPEGSLRSLKKNPFKELPSDCIFHAFNLENLNEIYKMVETNAEEEENTLLYLDDLGADFKNGGKQLENLFKRMCFNRRHLRLSIINCIQRLYSVPAGVRAMTSDLIFFKLGKNENKILYDELIDISKDKYAELCKFCFRSKHDCIMVNLNEMEFYRNFNKIEDFLKDEDLI